MTSWRLVPFFLDIDNNEDALIIEVSLQIGRVAERANVSSPDLGQQNYRSWKLPVKARRQQSDPAPRPLPGDKALDIFWDKRIREAGKMVRLSPLFPKAQRRAGKAQFNWAPTTDLMSRWPISFFIWGGCRESAFGGGRLLVHQRLCTTACFAGAHAKSSSILPPIALRANANSCTSCHAFAGNMESNCAGVIPRKRLSPP